ncbi:MAG: hypothetical protein NXI10_12910 [bacterium]|nr:hypothetical protein [bacterium]
MEKIKTILDRKPLSSEYIRSKQDFANVVKGAKGLGKPYWQTNWFYGTVGVAAVAIIVTAVTLADSDIPEKSPKNNAIVAAAETDDSTKEDVSQNNSEQLESLVNEEGNSAEVENSTEETSSKDDNSEENTTTSTSNNDNTEIAASTARSAEETQEAEKKPEIGLPNVAGVTGGPIAFKDFCDPLGIQVNGGVLIHQYTIQYRSCARDITARIRGNRLPAQVCDEIRDCGSPIEVTFSNFKAEDSDGNPVQLKEFSLTTRP